MFTTFVNGFYEKIQTLLYIERVSTFAEAVRLASAYYLARSHNIRDAQIPKPMHFKRTKGTPAHVVESVRWPLVSFIVSFVASFFAKSLSLDI